MSKQLLKSGTAIGALVREAEQAESKVDFIHKLAIVLKEPKLNRLLDRTAISSKLPRGSSLIFYKNRYFRIIKTTSKHHKNYERKCQKINRKLSIISDNSTRVSITNYQLVDMHHKNYKKQCP